MPGNDRIDVRKPCPRFVKVAGGERGSIRGMREHPIRKPAGVRTGVDVRAGPDDDVEMRSCRIVKESVEVAHAGKIVRTRPRRMISPIQIGRYGIVTVSAQAFEHSGP